MNLWQSIAHTTHTRTLSRWCDKIIYSQHLIRSYDVMHATILTVLTFCVGIGIYLKFCANKSPRDSIACHTNTRLLVCSFVRSQNELLILSLPPYTDLQLCHLLRISISNGLIEQLNFMIMARNFDIPLFDDTLTLELSSGRFITT